MVKHLPFFLILIVCQKKQNEKVELTSKVNHCIMYDGQTYEVMFVTQYKERQAIPDCALRGKGCTLFFVAHASQKIHCLGHSDRLGDIKNVKRFFFSSACSGHARGLMTLLRATPFVCLSLRGCSTPKTPPVPRITVPLLANFSTKQFSSSVARSQPFQKLFAQN